MRTSRSAPENIIPTTTDSPAIVEKVLPEMEGKLSGIALNVPVADGSNIDLVAFLENPATAEEINELVHGASDPSGPIGWTDEPIVSSDVKGAEVSVLFDSLQTMVCEGDMVKTLGWYDQGGGLAHRIVDTIGQLAAGRAS